MSIVLHTDHQRDVPSPIISVLRLDQIKVFVSGGQPPSRVAQVLSERPREDCEARPRRLFQKRPDVILSRRQRYGRRDERPTFFGDIDLLPPPCDLRMVRWRCDSHREIGIIGAPGDVRALGTPWSAWPKQSVKLRTPSMGLLTEPDAEEAGFYFDYVSAPSPEARPFLPPASSRTHARRDNQTSINQSDVQGLYLGLIPQSDALSSNFASWRIPVERRNNWFQRSRSSRSVAKPCSLEYHGPGGNHVTTTRDYAGLAIR